MRLLLKVKSKKEGGYDFQYYHKLQGLVYNCLEETHSLLHDKKGYKFFCFSNIFPISDFIEGDIRNLVISSPDPSIIKALNASIPDFINVGGMEFDIVSRRILDCFLRDYCILVTPTPIVVRIPRMRYSDYGIKSHHDYVYWRVQYPLNAFLKQLEENLLKKYNEYHGEELDIPLVFEDMQPLKNPAVYTTINNKTVQIVGSTWKFHLNKPTPGQKKLLEFCIDCGFGELNTLGFGFINQARMNN